MRRRLLIPAIILLSLAALIGGFGAWLFVAFDRPGPLTQAEAVVIPRGASVDVIGRLLAEKNVVSHPLVFSMMTRLTGNAARLQPGEYRFGIASSPRAAMNLILSGKRVAHQLTVSAGLTTAQIIKLLKDTDGLDGTITATPDEGALLPATYQYFWGDDRDAMIETMAHAHDQTVAELWAVRPSGSLLKSPEDAVILASIIDSETKNPKEQLKVSSVLANRMRHGMSLQSDPTVAYGVAKADKLPDGVLKRRLTRKDLQRKTPYNTYIVKGLPPTPICNPSRKALQAALHPAKTNYLFFAADGERTAFARTLSEHKNNIARLQASLAGENVAKASTEADAAP